MKTPPPPPPLPLSLRSGSGAVMCPKCAEIGRRRRRRRRFRAERSPESHGAWALPVSPCGRDVRRHLLPRSPLSASPPPRMVRLSSSARKVSRCPPRLLSRKLEPTN